MSTSELDSRNITFSMRKSVENLVISSQDAIGQSISQALTFSGVITQHANQIIQETRNVSRPPSPSIRNVEPGLDSLDNDKVTFQGSNLSLHVASHSSADSASVSSATDLVTIVNAPLKGDKVTSPNPAARTADGAAGRSKKKSWYNSLYPTYKSKSEDFKRLFKDLPDDERLIVDYSCALQKDILVHGRLYASQNYLCFYASIFGWETSMSLRWKDVTAITKEKTALVIPNAILVCTEADKNFLTSFSRRDKTYLMLFRIWQNALMDQPMTSHEIWQWVHSCYGEELGFNSDDEGYGRDFPEEAAVLPPDNVSEDLVDSSMEASGGADSRDEAQHSRGRHSAGPRDCSPPLVTNGEAGYNEEEAADALPTDMSDTSDSEPDKPHNGGEPDKCTASHEGKLLLRQQFPFNVDQLFTMIFTNSKFNLELLAARGTTDYVQAPWQPAAGLKCRQLSYTLGLTSGPIGPKEVQVTETQVMNKCSKPGVLYSIDSTSENAGIPYADYFSVKVHYCLQRVAEHATSLTIIAHIHYKKTMWPMVKGFLEKNTMSGLEEYTRLIESHLGGEAHRAAPPRAHRRHRRPIASPQEAAVTAAVKSPAVGVLAPRGSVSRPPRASATDRWLLASLLLLLLLNALLYWKLYRAHSPRPGHVDQLHARMSSTASGGGAQAAEWARLLAHHARQQRAQLHDWRQALDATRTHLLQTEQALMKLLETIKPSLEAAKAATDEDKRTDL